MISFGARGLPTLNDQLAGIFSYHLHPEKWNMEAEDNFPEQTGCFSDSILIFWGVVFLKGV